MNEQELFDLRKKGEFNFDAVSKLALFIENLLGEKRIFPLVVGYADFNPTTNWRIEKLSPLNSADRLTIENYLLGLKELQKEANDQLKLSTRLFYEGVDTMHYSNWDSQILTAYARDVRNPSQTFDLVLNLSSEGHSDDQRVGYAAHSSIDETRLEKIAKRFVGPNVGYKKVLL